MSCLLFRETKEKLKNLYLCANNRKRNMKPVLFVLAAGMGSRYGGLKQLDGVGPNGETIMDYSLHDAIAAGFGKVVFVIRRSFEKEFKEKILSKYESQIDTEVVFQEVDSLPTGYVPNEERVRPWGTGHAVLMGMNAIKVPFAVINSDDFYGKESFEILAKFLKEADGKVGQYCMVGYRIENTLSESGTVNRGVCMVDAEGHLMSIKECEKIGVEGGKIVYADENGEKKVIANGTHVSMNMWGFTLDYFEHSKRMFIDFLNQEENLKGLKSEFYIPTVVNSLIQSGEASVKVLDTPSKWMGVTYAEDKQSVMNKIETMVKEGQYPNRLSFNKN